MFEITDWIVGFWFVPVTIFIIAPLLMLCGWKILQLLKQLKQVRESQEQELN